MKSKLVLCIIILTNVVYSVLSQEYNYTGFYRSLDTSRITTGILYNTVIPYASINHHTGINDSTLNVKGDWLQIYNELFNAYLIKNKALIPLQSVKELINEANNSGIIPLGFINVKYNQFKDSALLKNLISIQNDCLIDGPSFSESPYVEINCFSASVLCNDIDSLNLTFTILNNLIFNNNSNQLLFFKIDFGDGNGYSIYNISDEHLVNYTEYGSKILNIVGYLSNGDSLSCWTTFNIIDNSIIQIESQQLEYMSSENLLNTELLNQYLSQDFVSEPINISIDDEDIFDDKNYSGRYKIWYGCGSEGILKKPLIIVEGFDPTNTNTLENGLYDISNQNGLLNTLRENGFDIVILDFDDGGGKIRGNAMVLKRLIREINENKTEKNDIVIIGGSMGGLVTKYALRYMEDNLIDHQTSLFISLDTPHKGAYVSLGLQFFMAKLENAYINDDLKKIISLDQYEKISEDMIKINCDAAKQMLVYHYSTSLNMYPNQHQDRTNFINDPYNKFPTKCKNIAISCGSGRGDDGNQGYGDGSTLVYYDDYTDIIIPFSYTINGEINYSELICEDIAFLFLNLKSIPDDIYTWLLGFSLIFKAGFINGVPIGSFFLKSLQNIYMPIYHGKPYDNCPGGSMQFIKSLTTSLEELGLPEFYYNNKECFVPSISALDLNTDNLFYNIYGNLTGGHNYFINNGNTITPFSEFFIDSDNHPHIKDGMIPEMTTWILDHVINETLMLQDKTYSSVEKQFEAKTEIISGSGPLMNNLEINNNSIITFVAGESIMLNPGFSVELGSEFNAYIKTYNCTFSDLSSGTSTYEMQNSPIIISQNQISTTINKSIRKENSLIISPNPSNGLFRINFQQKENEKWSFKIVDMMGNVVYMESPLNSTNEYYLKKPGVYFVQLKNNNELIKIEKLIIK